MNNVTRIIGIDPGLRRCGWGVVDSLGNSVRFVASGSVTSDGDLDLAQIGVNGIARIEVVEGPLSVSYGSNALAGTINLITKRNAGTAPSVKLSAYAEFPLEPNEALLEAVTRPWRTE